MPEAYDIIVIGGGHAGAEAAWAASRLGAKTAVVSLEFAAPRMMSERLVKISSATIGSGNAIDSTTWLTTSSWCTPSRSSSTRCRGN